MPLAPISWNSSSTPSLSPQGLAGGAEDANEKTFRLTEWRQAADKLKQNTDNGGVVGRSCGWDAAVFNREASDYISVTGEKFCANASTTHAMS